MVQVLLLQLSFSGTSLNQKCFSGCSETFFTTKTSSFPLGKSDKIIWKSVMISVNINKYVDGWKRRGIRLSKAKAKVTVIQNFSAVFCSNSVSRLNVPSVCRFNLARFSALRRLQIQLGLPCKMLLHPKSTKETLAGKPS